MTPQEAISISCKKLPSLCRQGGAPPSATEEGTPLSKDDHAAVAACLDWLGMMNLRKTPNPDHSSYGYKHRVERWQRLKGRSLYVPNGAFIAAALALDVPHGPPALNMKFGILEESLDRLWKAELRKGGRQ